MNNVRNLVFVAIAGALAACSPKPADNSAAAPETPAMGAAAPAATTAAAAPLPAAAPVTPGGTIEQAATASIGTAIDGEITKPDQADYYRFDVSLAQRDLAVVRLENKSSTLKPDFKVFTADRSQTGEFYDGTPGASVQTTMALEPGKAFFVAVLANGSGKYTLSVVPQKAFDSYEPNDDILSAKPVALGTPIEASVMDGMDSDWFRITGATQKTMHVTFENLSTTLKPDVKTFSSTKSQTNEKYDGTPGANLDFSFDVDPGKDFYLQVVPGGAGKYRLTVAPDEQAAP
jgi:hypothetical protein